DAVDVDRAALVRSLQLRLVDTLLAEPAAQLDERDDLAVVLLGEGDRVSDVIAVPMRDRDHVDALRRLLALRALGVSVQERVDVAAAASFAGAGAALEGHGSWLRAGSTSAALVLLVLGSAVRANGPAGGHLPTLAVSTLVLAVAVYVAPVLGWLVQPLALRPR